MGKYIRKQFINKNVLAIKIMYKKYYTKRLSNTYTQRLRELIQGFKRYEMYIKRYSIQDQ